jgi:hypothetical protein
MIVNETLPIIADPVLGGGVQAVRTKCPAHEREELRGRKSRADAGETRPSPFLRSSCLRSSSSSSLRLSLSRSALDTVFKSVQRRLEQRKYCCSYLPQALFLCFVCDADVPSCLIYSIVMYPIAKVGRPLSPDPTVEGVRADAVSHPCCQPVALLLEAVLGAHVRAISSVLRITFSPHKSHRLSYPFFLRSTESSTERPSSESCSRCMPTPVNSEAISTMVLFS